MKKYFYLLLFFIGQSYTQQETNQKTLVLKRSCIENFLKELKGSRIFKPGDKAKRTHVFPREPKEYLPILPNEIISYILELANITRVTELYNKNIAADVDLMKYLKHESELAKPGITQHVLIMILNKKKVDSETFDQIKKCFPETVLQNLVSFMEKTTSIKSKNYFKNRRCYIKTTTPKKIIPQ